VSGRFGIAERGLLGGVCVGLIDPIRGVCVGSVDLIGVDV
jgi:hypothetical protein